MEDLPGKIFGLASAFAVVFVAGAVWQYFHGNESDKKNDTKTIDKRERLETRKERSSVLFPPKRMNDFDEENKKVKKTEEIEEQAYKSFLTKSSSANSMDLSSSNTLSEKNLWVKEIDVHSSPKPKNEENQNSNHVLLPSQIENKKISNQSGSGRNPIKLGNPFDKRMVRTVIGDQQWKISSDSSGYDILSENPIALPTDIEMSQSPQSSIPEIEVPSISSSENHDGDVELSSKK